MFRVHGFAVRGLGFGVSGFLGFLVRGSGLRFRVSGFHGSGFRVQGFRGFTVSRSGFGVSC